MSKAHTNANGTTINRRAGRTATVGCFAASAAAGDVSMTCVNSICERLPWFTFVKLHPFWATAALAHNRARISISSGVQLCARAKDAKGLLMSSGVTVMVVITAGPTVHERHFHSCMRTFAECSTKHKNQHLLTCVQNEEKFVENCGYYQ